MELATAPFHLPQPLRDVAAALSPRMQQKALEFVFDPAPELPDIVLGDAVKLRQVLDNLLGNAVKFTAAGSVRLEVRLAGDERVLFSVSDTGVGITEADRAKLFQPFQQAADGRPPEPGTGLGLAISQRMVELMGGELAVETRPGHGSRFFFTLALPVLATDASAPRSTASLITGYQGRRRRLLVVDDIATNRDVLRDLLAPLGFEIETAASGTEALAALAAAAPDLVFLDLRMPGIDGLELTRRIRQRTGGAAIKIIAMSASVLSFNRGDALAAGCDDFLPKPFREDDLLARLGLALQLEWVGDLSGETEHGRGLAARAAARAATADSAAPFQVTSTLAGEELRELLAIAQRGEITALRARLEMCRRDPLVDALTALARNYRMERIREVLETRLGAAVPERKRP